MIARTLVALLLLFIAETAWGKQASSSDAAVATATSVTPEAARLVEAPPATAEAMRYYASGNLLWLINTALGLAVPALFLFSGFSGRMGRFANRIGRYWFVTIVLYFLLFSLLIYVINLPLSFYQGFVREHALRGEERRTRSQRLRALGLARNRR